MFTVFVYLINVLLVERRCINNAKLMLVGPFLILPKGNRPYNKPEMAVKIIQPETLTDSGNTWKTTPQMYQYVW